MVMDLLAFTKTCEPKPQGNPDSAANESKPNTIGIAMLTYAQMRAHKHTENRRCACHDIEATLALVPEEQQRQFVRVYPRPQPRHAKYPTGVSMFREELDVEMTRSRQDSVQQPQPSLDSMVMAPVTAEGYSGSRGLGSDKADNEQFCVPKVAHVVSTFFAQALRAVRFEPAPLPAPLDGILPVKNDLPEPRSDTMPWGVSKPQPSTQVTVELQRCNAVRYRNDRRPRPRPQLHLRKDKHLGYRPGGEADKYYLSAPVAVQQTDRTPIIQKPEPAKLPQKQSIEGTTIFEDLSKRSSFHPTRPDSPFPMPQQRTKPPEEPVRKVCKHNCRDDLPVSSHPRYMHTNKAVDGLRPPPLRGKKKLPSLADMPGLPPPIRCDGYLLWPNLGTLRIASGPALPSSSSSRRNYADTEFSTLDHVSNDKPEVAPTSR